VLKDKVFLPLDYDSHEQMIKELKLDDTTTNPQFVRVEITPKDNDIFNHNLDNWQLKVDQDFKPDWFNEKLAEEEIKEKLSQWFQERFVINREIAEIGQGRWYLKNGIIQKLYGTACAEHMRDSSQVGEMWESSQVGVMRDSSQVGVMRDSSQVGVMWDRSQVRVMWDRSQVGVMRDSSQVGEMWESSQVGVMRDSSQVGVMRDSSQVKNCQGPTPIIYTPDKTIKLKIWKPKKVKKV